MKLSLTKKRVLFIVISLVVVSLAYYFTSTGLKNAGYMRRPQSYQSKEVEY